ncbi:MAG: multidrug efflux transporter [Myxococcaceae bacterium]|nr:multidrug efflux transporter [Myxococcaceae bacterium]
MQWLAELCVKRPVFATVLSLVILVVGGVFYTKLGVDQFPKIDFPAVTVITRLPGASPEDVETEISDKIEGAVNTISGIDELRSISSEGVSMVIVTFKLEKDVNVASQEVQQKVNAALSELPRGIDPPIVQKMDPDAQPVLYIALNAKDKETREITDIADRVVRRRLESVSGVGQVRIIGGRQRQINVAVDPVKLRALGLPASEVARAIDAQNVTLPGGRVDTSRDYLTLRVNGRVSSVEQLRSIVVREQNGRAIRLDEVATIEDGLEDVETSAMWNGERTVLLSLRKQSGTNTLQVVDAVKERMEEVRKDLPPDFDLQIQRDGSAVVRTGTDAVNEHLVLGALFAALVVLIFLGNVRSTVIAAVAIPTSIVGTFALMYLNGYTLNTITLLALALAVGIVIDDAIVVLENIYKQIEEKGLHPMQAAIVGTQEIGLAVLATTLSLIAVFLPIAFIAGIPGRFLGSFGITMSFAIGVSLFVSFTLTPMLASRWLKKKLPGVHKKPLLERMVDNGYRPIERVYARVLKFSMAHRWLVVLACVATMASIVPLAKAARKGFLPVDDRAQFEVVVRLPEGRSVPATELVGERVARIIRAMPEVTATLVTVGDDEQRTPNSARIYVKLVPPDQRTATQAALKDLVRQKILPTLPKDLRVSIGDVNEFGGGQSTAKVQYILAGPDLRVLTEANGRVLEKLRQIPGAVDVDTSMIVGKPELSVFVDRARAADLGVQVVDVAAALQLLVGGQKVSSYAENGEQYDIRLRATPEFRSSEDQLQLITVPSRKVGLVSLSEVVRVQPTEGPSSILRYQRERQVTFMVNPGPGVSEGELGDTVKQVLLDENFPKGFGIKPQGTTKLMRETGISFALGLLASMLFMYLILAAQFESWLHPITILVSLPLTLPFAIASVILFDQALDLYSFLGIFVLFGVVKKNAILQIDHTNKLREKGMPRAEAIIKGNVDRLRPILMTTFAFVAGMIPLVTARGIGSGFNRATAGVVVGGQVLSLALTLMAVPVAYSLLDDLSVFMKRMWRKAWGPAEEPVRLSEIDAAEEVGK